MNHLLGATMIWDGLHTGLAIGFVSISSGEDFEAEEGGECGADGAIVGGEERLVPGGA